MRYHIFRSEVDLNFMSLEETQREFAELRKALQEAQRAFASGNFAQAEQEYKRGLLLCERLYGEEHGETLECLQNLADTYYSLRRYQDAIPTLRRLLEVKQKVKPANPEIAALLFKLSRTYDKLGQQTESEAFHKITVRMGEQVFGPDSTFVATVLESLLKVLRRNPSRSKEAEKLEERLHNIRAKLAPSSSRDTAGMLGYVADTIEPGAGPRQRNLLDALAPGLSGASGSGSDTIRPSLDPAGGSGPQYSTIPPGRGLTMPPGHGSRSAQSSTVPPDAQSNTFPPGKGLGLRADTLSPGKITQSQTQSNPLSNSQITETGEIHRPTSMRFKGIDPDGSKLPKEGLNDSQRIAIVLSLSLVGFLCFCFYTLVSLKNSGKLNQIGQTQALSALFPDGVHSFTQKAQESEDSAKKTPIYSSPDGKKQITLTDGEHALMTSHGATSNATYTISPPYITLTPEHQSANYSFQKTDDSLIDQDGNVLYALWAPETTIINEMKVLASTATKFYKSYSRYPTKPEELMLVAHIISYENPFTHQACWPVKRQLLGLDDTNPDFNVTDLTNLQNAAKELHIWKAAEAIEPGTVEFFHVPTGGGRDLFIIRGSDRNGRILRSSQQGLTDMILCINGLIRE